MPAKAADKFERFVCFGAAEGFAPRVSQNYRRNLPTIAYVVLEAFKAGRFKVLHVLHIPFRAGVPGIIRVNVAESDRSARDVRNSCGLVVRSGACAHACSPTFRHEAVSPIVVRGIPPPAERILPGVCSWCQEFDVHQPSLFCRMKPECASVPLLTRTLPTPRHVGQTMWTPSASQIAPIMVHVGQGSSSACTESAVPAFAEGAPDKSCIDDFAIRVSPSECLPAAQRALHACPTGIGKSLGMRRPMGITANFCGW